MVLFKKIRERFLIRRKMLEAQLCIFKINMRIKGENLCRTIKKCLRF